MKYVKEFFAKNGEKISLRLLRCNDPREAKELQKVINEIALRSKLSDYVPVSASEMKELMAARSTLMKKKKGIFLVIEARNRIIGECTVHAEEGTSSHIGTVGIGIVKEYQNQGIGQKALHEIIALAKKIKGIEILKTETSETNKPAINAYQKVGFKLVAKIPKAYKIGNKYISEVILYLPLKA